MVYCGKPSKGCSHCRERKIRCDQKEPGCGQCEKRKQDCPGYRNLVDLMFRDESSHVINKAARGRTRNNTSQAKPRSSRRKGTSSSASAGGFLTPGLASASGSPTSPSPTPTPVSTPKSVAQRPLPIPGMGILYPSAPAASPPESVYRPSPWPSPTTLPAQEPLKPLDVGEDDGVSESSQEVPASFHISTSLQERGTAFFFSRYVAPDNGCHQNYGFIYDIWKPPDQTTGPVRDCVSAGMTAVGLAGLAQVTGCRKTMKQARHCYGEALKLTKAALRDPVNAIKDTTMLSALMLRSFEFISGRCPQTMRAWQEHVNGAAAMASLRGSAQFRTKAGVRMFLMLSQSLLINCIQSGLPMPRAMVELRREIRPSQEEDNLALKTAEPTYRALQVCYDIRIGKLSDVDNIVRTLSDIDDEFGHLLCDLPPSWQYNRVQLTRPDPRVLGLRCHVYSGHLQATTWNATRAIRMLVLETILEQLWTGSAAHNLASLPYYYQEQLTRTVKLLKLLGEAIVASLPQHLGVVSFRDIHPSANKAATVSVSSKPQPHRLTSPKSTPPECPPECPPEHYLSPRDMGTPTLLDPTQSKGHEGNSERFMTLASTSDTIIWPLYILGMSSSCPTETKHYVIRSLHDIHRESGLEPARLVADMLAATADSSIYNSFPWDELPRLRDGALPSIV